MLKLLCINSLCCFKAGNYEIDNGHCSACKSTITVQKTIAAITTTSVAIYWSLVMLNTPCPLVIARMSLDWHFSTIIVWRFESNS